MDAIHICITNFQIFFDFHIVLLILKAILLEFEWK